MTNTYLITPIKRTLENKKHPNWCFFKTMIGKMATLETVLITQYKITNVNKTPEWSMTFDVF
jgi:LEA14-like dessication related protein